MARIFVNIETGEDCGAVKSHNAQWPDSTPEAPHYIAGLRVGLQRGVYRIVNKVQQSSGSPGWDGQNAFVVIVPAPVVSTEPTIDARKRIVAQSHAEGLRRQAAAIEATDPVRAVSLLLQAERISNG